MASCSHSHTQGFNTIGEATTENFEDMMHKTNDQHGMDEEVDLLTQWEGCREELRRG